MELTHSDIRTRVLERMQVSTDDPNWRAVASLAINEGQRLFAFLTLCLEARRSLVLLPGTKFYHMLAIGWDDWLVPLRVRPASDSGGATSEFDSVKSDESMFGEELKVGSAVRKLRPATIYQMAALDESWISATGSPTRYGCIGWDLFFLDKSPTDSGEQLVITYARSPIPLAADADVPEIPDADHESLISYGVARLRANEGGQELQVSNALLKEYLDAARRRAAQVRARSLAQKYDRQPFELEAWDYARVLAPPVAPKDRTEGR